MRFPHQLIKSLLVLSLIGGGFPAFSQETKEEFEALYQAPWEITTDSGTSLYIIVKKGGLASFFYADRNDNTVYNGKWEVFGDALFIEWETGRTDVLRAIDSSNFRIAMFNTGYTGDEQPDDVGISKKLPESEVGTWTVPPEELQRMSTAREEVEGFFGTWEVRLDDGYTYYIVINDDRTAASSYSRTRKGVEGLQGVWNRQGAELHIQWDTGHYQIIRELNNYHDTELFADATDLKQEATRIRTRRVDQMTATKWLAANEEESTVIARVNAFRSRKEVNAFFRGRWFLIVDGEPVQEIDIGRYGDIEIVDSNMKGEWRSQTDSMYLYWNDGFRAILKPVYLSFTVSIYAPGQPFDGTPTRIYSAIPADPEKMTIYQTLKEDATLRLKFFREVQERIDALPPEPKERRKRKWWQVDVWPF